MDSSFTRAVAYISLGLSCLLPITPTQSQTAGVRPDVISDSGLALIYALAKESQRHFWVYKDGDSGVNHGTPSGFFASSDAALLKIHVDAFCIDAPTEPTGCTSSVDSLDTQRGNVIQLVFDTLNSDEFVGLVFEEPEGWVTTKRGVGYDLTGTSGIEFDARSPTPGGITVEFGVNERTSGYTYIPESPTFITKSISLSDLGLSASNLGNVHALFSVAVNELNTPNGGILLLDNIRLKPVPDQQGEVLSFPRSTETFGVVPAQEAISGRVPIPPDQVMRNVTTTYESALAIDALLTSSNTEHLDAARRIADAMIYALDHDNQGAPLPKASGNTGLHNAYMTGSIALHNSQGDGKGQKGQVRLAGFSASTDLCGETAFCLVLDGATGGNVSFAILALLAAYEAFTDLRYLDGARQMASWVHQQFVDADEASFGGYFVGYPDAGAPKEVILGKSIENVADIYAAFTELARIEAAQDNVNDAEIWQLRAHIAGDFVMELFDTDSGCFYAGTVPIGTDSSAGILPSDRPGDQRGSEVINRFHFLDANTFVTLALAASPRYKDQIDWRRPVQCALDNYQVAVTAADQTYEGFNLVRETTTGPEGIAWEFTAQMVVTMRFVDGIYKESNYTNDVDKYLGELRKAQERAPFGDKRGVVASTMEGGNQLTPIEQCLSTPFQCIPERVGLAATAWAIFAERDINPLAATEAVTVGLEEVPIPSGRESVVSSPYPNPFSYQTSFVLTLALTQEVQVTAYNALGQRVQVIYEGRVRSHDPHQIVLNTEDLPDLSNGIYLIRITGETFTTTHSVALLK